jgi:hypothetical protein
MNSTAIRIVALVALAAMGCVPPPVRRVNRAALVPRLTPSLGDGAPMAQPVELAFGAASLAAARAPGPGDGDAALEVPGTQLAGSVRFRFADYASIGFGYAAGLDASAQPIRPHQAPVDGGDAVGDRDGVDRGGAGGAAAGRSAPMREAEVDAAEARIGPARGDDLGARVEAHAVGAVDVQVAEQRRLPAAERVVRHRHRDRHVDADHADLDLVLELAGGAAVVGEQRHAVGVGVAVDQRDRLIVRVDARDAEHRAEDLVLVDRHRRLTLSNRHGPRKKPFSWPGTLRLRPSARSCRALGDAAST